MGYIKKTAAVPINTTTAKKQESVSKADNKVVSTKNVKSTNKEQIISANTNVSKNTSARGSRLLDVSKLTPIEKRKYTKLKTSIESLYNERRRIEKELKFIFSKDEFAKIVYEDIQRNNYYSQNNERRRNLKK